MFIVTTDYEDIGEFETEEEAADFIEAFEGEWLADDGNYYTMQIVEY